MPKSERRSLSLLLGVALLFGSSLPLPAQTDTAGIDSTVSADTAAGTDTLAEPLDFGEFIDSIASSRFVYDSSSPSLRSFNEADMSGYRQESEFDYARTAEPSSNFLAKIFDWFFRLIDGIFGNEVTGRMFLYILFGIALVLVIWLVLRGEGGGLFMRRGAKQTPIDFEEMPEDIHAIDFDRLIAEALAAGEFRRAVRLHYLKTLRSMSERGIIEWSREKTNADYLREVERDDLRSRFAELTILFDYVWYGGFEIDRGQYGRMGEAFASFRTSVEGRG